MDHSTAGETIGVWLGTLSLHCTLLFSVKPTSRKEHWKFPGVSLSGFP